MHVGRTNPNFDYFMNGEKLTETLLERDIGFLIDKSLKPSNQSSQCSFRSNMSSFPL